LLLQVQPRVFVETNAPQIVAVLEPGFSSRYQVSGAEQYMLKLLYYTCA